MLKKLSLAVGVAALAGCNIPGIETFNEGRDRAIEMMGMTQPAGMMVYTEDDAEAYLSGEMRRKMNGEVFFLISGPDWGNCEGLVSARLSVVSPTCENGYSFTDELRTDATQDSGVIEFFGNENGQSYVAFIGWGDVADEASLRAAFAAYASEI